MSNTLLTPTMITRKAIQVLHQKSNFIGRTERQYDDRFAKDGGKIGGTLQIRMPNRYTIGTGAAITPQDTTEQKQDLTVATQKHVPMQFLSSELTLSLDDFSDRIIEPAMMVLAANAEADCLTMAKDVYNQTGTPGTTPNTALPYLTAHALVSGGLAPIGKRCYHIRPLDNATLVDALKALQQSAPDIAEQYREGIMGRAFGGDWYENTLMPRVTVGNKVASVVVSGGSQTGSSLTIGGVSAADTFLKGQVFTIQGVNSVHPESRADTGQLQKFVVTADTTSAGTTVAIPISPSIVVTGALQTVNGSPANNAPITFDGTANLQYGMNLHFYKTAFAVVFADLDMPKGLDFAHREQVDGISLRVLRQFEARTDLWVTRADILYGYKTIRPEFACRIATS